MKILQRSDFIALVLGISLLSGCNVRLPGQPTQAQRWRAPGDVTDFDQLYTQNCAGCHGAGGRLGAARSLNDPLYLAFVSDEGLREVISQGRAGTSMPAFSMQSGGSLTDQQVDLLVKGMRAHWSKPDDYRSIALPGYSAKDKTGDAARGATAYQTFCSSCHGADGAGGSAGSIVDPNFLNLTSDQGLRTTVIVGRADMGKPDWRGNVPSHPMSAQEINDVVAWLAARRQATNVTVSKVDHSAYLNMK